MLFSEALGRTVVSTDTASTVGRVDDYVVDPQLPGIVALTVSKTSAVGSALPWANIIAALEVPAGGPRGLRVDGYPFVATVGPGPP